MDIPYASLDAGRSILVDLQVVASKWKQREQLFLPNFLEVDPGTPYATWMTQVKNSSRHFRNNPSKPGSDEAAQLCKKLAREFKDLTSWRGLLNRLGWLHIDMDVKRFSKSTADADLVDKYFQVLEHEIRTLVGTPDYKEVVQAVFNQYGVSVSTEQPSVDEEYEDRVPVPPRPDEAETAWSDRDETDRTDRSDEDETEARDNESTATVSAPSSFWGMVGRMAVEVGKEIIKKKLEEATQKAEQEREILRQTPNIAGSWWSGAGARLRIRQRGVHLEIEGHAPQGAIMGQGVMRGRQAELWLILVSQMPMLPQMLTLRQMQMPMPMQPQVRLSLSLDVTPDGQAMEGVMHDPHRQQTPVTLYRQ
jgi:hypothetical protein